MVQVGAERLESGQIALGKVQVLRVQCLQVAIQELAGNRRIEGQPQIMRPRQHPRGDEGDARPSTGLGVRCRSVTGFSAVSVGAGGPLFPGEVGACARHQGRAKAQLNRSSGNLTKKRFIIMIQCFNLAQLSPIAARNVPGITC